MIAINSTLAILLRFLLLLFLNLNNGIETSEKQKIVLTEKNNCKIENVTLKTERIEKERKFLFWTLKHKKVIVTDLIEDSNGNKIFENKSVFICSMDACDTRKYRRTKIVENEIWTFQHDKNYNKGFIKRYDFCGKFLGKQEWKEKSFEEY